MEFGDISVRDYLATQAYPEGASKSDKRRLRSKAANYSLVNGQLHYQVKPRRIDSQKERHQELRRVLFNDADKEAAMKELHGGRTGGGHLGQRATLHKVEQVSYFMTVQNISILLHECTVYCMKTRPAHVGVDLGPVCKFLCFQRYFWTNMSKDIILFVRRCRTCQVVNKKFTNRNMQLHPIPIEEPRFFSFVAIDCITHLPLSVSGNSNIVVVTDKFTKFAFARATACIQAPVIASYLYELFCTYGWPKVLLSDQVMLTIYTVVLVKNASNFMPFQDD